MRNHPIRLGRLFDLDGHRVGDKIRSLVRRYRIQKGTAKPPADVFEGIEIESLKASLPTFTSPYSRARIQSMIEKLRTEKMIEEIRNSKAFYELNNSDCEIVITPGKAATTAED
jgi:hypothetical protein